MCRNTKNNFLRSDSGKKIDLRILLRKGMIFVLLLPIRFYRSCISPATPASCRYTPTCSEYAMEAIRKYGPLKGSWLALRRLSRCHPWGGQGYDPVP